MEVNQRLNFEVQIKATQRADHPNSVKKPQTVPSFVLVFNDDWDDYSYATWYALWYYTESDEKILVGELKILNREHDICYEAIPKQFNTPLPDDFCSLGLNSYYYKNLVDYFGKEMAYEVLDYLGDVAVDINRREAFEDEKGYKVSLLRDLSSEKALREAKMIIEDRSPAKFFSFNYEFHTPYNSETEVVWKVPVSYEPSILGRVFGVVGENGVGKTSMLKKFVEDFVSKELGGFKFKPLFNSLNVISSVSSDNYPNQEAADNIPYNYYNLDQTRENYDRILGAADRISTSKTLVNNRSKLDLYRDILTEVMGDWIAPVFDEIESDEWDDYELVLNKAELGALLPELSSGQLHILALATYLIADMHLSSLVIIDEPEVHLHPSSVVDFMLFLSNILRKFQSYAIIATHSPLIVREMINTNVYKFVRSNENVPLISRVAYDTFGEDISTLYNRIFGYDESMSLFTKIVETKARKNRRLTVKDIEDELSSELPMNLNARLRIFDILNKVRGDA